MTNSPVPAAIPRRSAALVLLRDGSRGLEVFMLRRHSALSFAPGALVFPGGAVEAGDKADSWPTTDAGLADRVERIAALRETYEEAAILLAVASDGRTPPVPETGMEPHALAGWLRRGGLRLATDALVPFAHWITPESRPKRFDTLFFLARAPEGQPGAADGGEAVEAMWLRPGDLLAAAGRDEVRLIFATRLNLMRLARSQTVDEALAAARRQPLVPILPQRVDTPRGTVLRIPTGAGYDVIEIALKDVQLG